MISFTPPSSPRPCVPSGPADGTRPHGGGGGPQRKAELKKREEEKAQQDEARKEKAKAKQERASQVEKVDLVRKSRTSGDLPDFKPQERKKSG